MDVDSALEVVGGYRRWHITLFVLLNIGLSLPLCWNTLSLVFVGWAPIHVCDVDLTVSTNISLDSITNSTDIFENNYYFQNITKPLQCHELQITNYYNLSDINSPSTSVERYSCRNGWKYKNDGYMTITEEWDLVCNQNYLSELLQVFFQIGCMIGDIVLSPLTDVYGRKVIFAISQGILHLLGVAISFSPSYTFFAVCTLLNGVVSSGAITSGKLLALELFDSKHRTIPGIAGQIFWTFGHLSLGVMAYYVVMWRYLQLILSAMPAVFFLLCYIFPESPVWLVMKGEIQKSEKVLRSLAKLNGVTLDPGKKLLSAITVSTETSEPRKETNSNCGSDNAMSTNCDDDHISTTTCNGKNAETSFSYERNECPISIQLSPYLESQQISKKSEITGRVPTVKDLFTNGLLLKYLFSSCMLWFSCLFVFIGLAFTTPSLAGNRFLNFAILGLMELPSPIVAAYLSERVGRRWTTFFFLMAAGCCTTLVAALYFINLDENVFYWTSIILLMAAKFFVFSGFSIVILYSKEFFPTTCRATSSGVSQIFGRFGVLSASFAVYLIKIQLTWAPFALFGLSLILCGLTVFLLPETKNRRLPETMEDCYDLEKNK